MTASAQVSILVSNAGPCAVDVWMPWFECLARSSSERLLRADGSAPIGFELGSGDCTNLVWTLPPGALTEREPDFCGTLVWRESSGLLADVRRRTIEIMADLGILPAVRWAGESGAGGTVFAGNIEPLDYFRVAYGWTRDSWARDLASMKASAQQGSSGTRYALCPSEDEYHARIAFIDALDTRRRQAASKSSPR
jgi:hypothetical protein